MRRSVLTVCKSISLDDDDEEEEDYEYEYEYINMNDDDDDDDSATTTMMTLVVIIVIWQTSLPPRAGEGQLGLQLYDVNTCDFNYSLHT